MIKKHKTTTFDRLGTLPVRDAKDNVGPLEVLPEHIKKGKAKDPYGCVRTVAILKTYKDRFPGKVLGARTFKTTTEIATLLNKKQQVLRYYHTRFEMHQINGLDSGSTSFKPGDLMNFLAPKGQTRLGGRLKPRGPHTATHGPRPRCFRRTAYLEQDGTISVE